MDDDQGAVNNEPDPNDPLNMKEHDWTFDPEGAIWPKATEVVDNKLSLGLIAWHPGNKMTRAMPCTFAAAEQSSRAAPPPPIGLGDSVSTYFMKENHENAYEDIRSLAHWPKVKRDPVFVEFPQECESYDVATVKAWRNRPDVAVEIVDDVEEEGEIGVDIGEINGLANSFDQPPQQETTDQGQPSADQSDTNTGQRPGDKNQYQMDQSQEDILASLGVEGPPRPVYPTPGPAYGAQSASKSGDPMDTMPQRQASNGPNPGMNYTQGQVNIPPTSNASNSYPPADDPIEQAIARAISGAQASEQQSTPPAPSEVVKHDPSDPEPYDPWNPDQGMPVPKNPSPAPSDKTHVGSDFDQDTTEVATSNGQLQDPLPMEVEEDLKPPLSRHESSASRKRSYDNFNDRDESDDDHKRRQSDDGNKAERPSKSRQSSDDAYRYVSQSFKLKHADTHSRRW